MAFDQGRGKLPAHPRLAAAGVRKIKNRNRTRAVLPKIIAGTMLRWPRKIRPVVARPKNRGRGAAAEQTGPADSRLGAAAGENGANGLGKAMRAVAEKS